MFICKYLFNCKLQATGSVEIDSIQTAQTGRDRRALLKKKKNLRREFWLSGLFCEGLELLILFWF